MPRPEKVQAVEEIKERFSDASASFLTEYRGLSVSQQQTLRRALRDAGASYKVLKMTLTKRALGDLGHNELDEYLAGPTAIAFAGDDPVPVAKALKDFGAENEALVIKAGWLNGEVLLPETVARLAEIESRDVLLAKIAGAAKAPLTKMAGMLGSMTRDAASMFSQLLEKKEAEAPAAVEEPAGDPEQAGAADAAAEESDAAEQAPADAEAAAAEEPAGDAETDGAADADAEAPESTTEDTTTADDAADTDGEDAANADDEPAAEEE